MYMELQGSVQSFFWGHDLFLLIADTFYWVALIGYMYRGRHDLVSMRGPCAFQAGVMGILLSGNIVGVPEGVNLVRGYSARRKICDWNSISVCITGRGADVKRCHDCWENTKIPRLLSF